MAIIKAKTHQCDNPECSTIDTVFPEDLGPQGITVSGVLHTVEGSGGFKNVYACSFECLRPAIKNAIWPRN